MREELIKKAFFEGFEDMMEKMAPYYKAYQDLSPHHYQGRGVHSAMAPGQDSYVNQQMLQSLPDRQRTTYPQGPRARKKPSVASQVTVPPGVNMNSGIAQLPSIQMPKQPLSPAAPKGE
jgi:hypothetical protein